MCTFKDRAHRKLLLCEGPLNRESGQSNCRQVSHIKCAKLCREPEGKWLCNSCDPNYVEEKEPETNEKPASLGKEESGTFEQANEDPTDQEVVAAEKF